MTNPRAISFNAFEKEVHLDKDIFHNALSELPSTALSGKKSLGETLKKDESEWRCARLYFAGWLEISTLLINDGTVFNTAAKSLCFNLCCFLSFITALIANCSIGCIIFSTGYSLAKMSGLFIIKNEMKTRKP